MASTDKYILKIILKLYYPVIIIIDCHISRNRHESR
ncbi:MAG: hypothetical protein J07HX5_01339 [halophilic archaeon J07HX5]|nr:MAG: hypothetical protein J07HX5_01339 [halophilic archaeon J07HX5]